MIRQENCRFCYPPDQDRIILKTHNFYVMLSLGQIVEGYMLIVSNEHIACCADISADYLSEFEDILGITQQAQREVYGASCFYEHGRSGSCLPDARGEPHCHHAHLHVVPTNVNVASAVAASYPGQLLSSWSSLHDLYKIDGAPYVLAQSHDAILHASVPDKIPRQFLRTIVAKGEGEPFLADWVAFPQYQVISRAVEQLRPVVARLIQASKLPCL